MSGENMNIIRRDNKIIIKNVSALGAAGIIELYSDDELTKVGEITAAGAGDFTTLKIGGAAVTKTAAQINALPVVEQAAEADLVGGADLPTTVTKVNNILAKLRLANIIADV